MAGDCHRNDTPIPLPVTSVSPLPRWNMNETSQCYSREIEPTGGNLMIDSSHFRSAQNFQMNHHYLREGEDPHSGFTCPQGYMGQQYQYTRHDNLTVPDDLMNAAFNLNSFEKPHGGGKCVTPCDCSAAGPQMVNPSGTDTIGNIGQPLLSMNLESPNHGGAVPFLTPGKPDERFMSFGSGSNKEPKSDPNMSRINITGNSERIFLPPVNTYHNQVGSRSFLNTDLDMNSAFSGFQNNSEVISDLAHTGDHKVMFDSRPGLHLGASYALQGPAAGDQNHYLRSVNRDLGLGGVKDIAMEFADVGHQNDFERFMALPSLPFVASQNMLCDNGQSGASGQLVPSSIGMITDQTPFVLPSQNYGKFSSQGFTSAPVVVATGSTRGQDPSSNQGQSQVFGSVQQPNSHLGSLSTSGIQTRKGNMTAQVSRPSVNLSLKRGASQPPASTVQVQRRRTIPAHPFTHPSIPTWSRLAQSVPNTSRSIPPLPQATHSFSPPTFSPTWTKSALSAPNITQANPPLMETAPLLLPQAHATVSLPPHDKRNSSLLRSSHTSPIPNQLIAQSLAHQRSRFPIIPSAASIAPLHIKYKDQTPEPIGHKCFLCKRDLSYTPEGRISQPSPPPAVAVLPCGHTFHDHCLGRITPLDQSKDPPCIPCALRE